jgi:hypothetical protein
MGNLDDMNLAILKRYVLCASLYNKRMEKLAYGGFTDMLQQSSG